MATATTTIITISIATIYHLVARLVGKESFNASFASFPNRDRSADDGTRRGRDGRSEVRQTGE